MACSRVIFTFIPYRGSSFKVKSFGGVKLTTYDDLVLRLSMGGAADSPLIVYVLVLNKEW
jgi:hypothetical protein